MTMDPEQLRVPQASLLAAYPDMLDPNFMHSVLLMCEHTDQGAYGLTVNRPTELTLDELFPNHELLRLTDFRVHLGGPVDATRFQFVHTVPDEISGGVALTERLYIGGDLDELGGFLTRVGGAGPRSVRAFVGCSSWAPGQLEVELATGSWLPAPLEHDILFDEDSESSWRRVLRSLGGATSGLENLPPDASWN